MKVASERVPLGIDGKKDNMNIASIVATLEPLHGLIALSEAELHDCHGVWRHVSLLRDGEESVHDVLGFFEATHSGEEIAAQCDDFRVDPKPAGIINRR